MKYNEKFFKFECSSETFVYPFLFRKYKSCSKLLIWVCLYRKFYSTVTTYTCVDSELNETCHGYACITYFYTYADYNVTNAYRTCQSVYQDEAMLGLYVSANAQNLPKPFCVSENGYRSTIVACYCYGDLCNAAANDANLPTFPNANVDCRSEQCSSSGCFSLAPNSTCKGQICYIGKTLFVLQSADFCIHTSVQRGSQGEGAWVLEQPPPPFKDTNLRCLQYPPK